MPSFRYALLRCISTVFTVTTSAWAISGFDAPAAARSAMRRSLGVRAAAPRSAALRIRMPLAADDGNGGADYRESVRRLHERFAGCRLEPLDIVAEDDRVVVRTRVSIDGVPSQQIHIWRLRNGRIVEHWGSLPGAADLQRRLEEET